MTRKDYNLITEALHFSHQSMSDLRFLECIRYFVNDLIELIVYELEQQYHLIQSDSVDKWCERCQRSSTYSCVTTNYKIDRRIKELRLNNDQCELCGAKPMTTNCNNGRCDD